MTQTLSIVLISLFALSIQDIAKCRSGAPSDSTSGSHQNSIKVFVDCDRCDDDYIREEIGFINYVRDRNQAQVHVLVATSSTGSGGTEYSLTFIGKAQFQGIDDTLSFTTVKAQPEDVTRTSLVKTLKLGLIRYVSKTPAADQISIGYSAATTNEVVKDWWDFWVFNLNMNTYVNGEQSTTSNSVYTSFSANRVTKDLKVKISAGFDYNENSYEYDSLVYESFSRGKNFDGLLAFSLDDHWSAGGFLSAWSSTYSNTDLAASIAPAIEYDLFPYSESTRRQLRFNWQIGYKNVKYIDTTIYDKTSEGLSYTALTISLDVKEQWGSAGVSVDASDYFHDLTKYSVGIFGNVSLRMVEGLSLDIFGNYNRIHDQLSLAKEGATAEEVLLQRKALETQYRYFVSVGVSYTFGSIFNNVVNPRFGSGSRSFSF